VVVEHALGIEFVLPFLGEPWPGAVAQQKLAAGAIDGFGAH
jgi:hypothetical protein